MHHLGGDVLLVVGEVVGVSLVLIGIEAVGGGCRRVVGRVPAAGRGAAAIAVDVHLENGGVVDETVDGGDRHRLIREDPIPGAEWDVGGDGEAAVLVPTSDQLEDDAGFRLILLGVSDVVEDDEVEAVEPGEGLLESQVTPGGLQPLHEVCGAGVEDAASGLDEGVGDGAEEVGLAGARVADGDEIIDPALIVLS